MNRYSCGRRNGGVLGVVLLIIALFAGVVAMAVFIVLRTVKVHENGGVTSTRRVSIDVPGGSFDISAHKRLDPETIGVPVYPGATLKTKDSSGGASFTWTPGDGKAANTFGVVGADYFTDDSADKVAAFYRGKLNNWIFVTKRNKEFNLETTQGTWKRIVAIHEQSDGTHIGVASIGEPAGNQRLVPETCTCGTRLVDGARFCHRCGRPAYEEDVEAILEQPQAQPSPSSVAAPASQLPVNLNNPIAIRVALIVSPLTVLASVLPLINILFLVWWIAGGWFAVNLYRRLTGGPMTVNAGARLGWIIGLLSFVGLSAVMAVTYAVMGKQIFQEMVKQNPQAAEVLNDPSAVVMALLVGLVIFFVAISGTCAAGGALGARFGAKNTPTA